MKRTIFFIQILLLLTAGSVFGADEYVEGRCGLSPDFNRTFWFKGTGTKPWCGALGESWWDDAQGYYPPTANDVVAIDNPVPATCVVDSECTAECLALYIGDRPANSQSEGDGEIPQTATLDVNDGNLTVVQDVMIGMCDTILPSDYAIGDFNIISGNVTVGCDLYIGREGIGYLNMRGGTLDVNGIIWCPGPELPEYDSQTYEYGTGYWNLYGGTITADDLMVYDEDGGITDIDICGGTLILNGDKTAKIADLVSEDKMYACGGVGNIEFDYNVRNPGKTTVTGVFDPNLATCPDPEHHATYISLTTDLSWTAGINANDVNGHDVYFGTSYDDVNDANNTPGVWPEFKGNQNSNTYDPCTGKLDEDTTYYWRIDEVNGPTTWKGYVWRFTTRNLLIPCCPDPFRNQTDVPIEKTFRWTKGIAANSHEVHVGTSFDDVNTSTTPTATVGDLANPFYNPPENHLLDQTYYWRVDGINTVTDRTGKGPVWKFKTFPYKDVDDMDNFITWTAAGGASWSKVFDAPLNDTKALELQYDNTSSPWDSNVTRPFVYTTVTNRRDWVSGGVEIFQIRFHGEQDNDVEQLYVTLKDADGNTATVLYSDPNHIVKQPHELWREWSVHIEEFNDAGINLADVRYFTIGLGDGASPGGEGTVYFDDIALYRPMCVNQDGDADITDDCKVDGDDIELLADGWLKAPYDVNINLGTYDMNVGLILWYKFDEGAGYTAADSSGNGHTGTMGFDNWETSDCYDGNCVDFESEPDQMYIDVPPAAAPNDLGGHSTVALWIKDAGVETEFAPFDQIGSQLFQIGPDDQGNLQAGTKYNGYFQYVCGWDPENNWQDTVVWGEDGYSNPEHPLNQWIHYAFVKDATEGVMRIYQNGEIVAEEYDATALKIAEIEPPASYFTIGAWREVAGTGGYYVGLMDDFRLYDRALSQEEIMDLADVNSVQQPVVSYAEVTGDGKVNFLDYAVTAAEWLTDPLLWPY